MIDFLFSAWYFSMDSFVNHRVQLVSITLIDLSITWAYPVEITSSLQRSFCVLENSLTVSMDEQDRKTGNGNHSPCPCHARLQNITTFRSKIITYKQMTHNIETRNQAVSMIAEKYGQTSSYAFGIFETETCV